MFKEFKEFALRGNVIDMAVGIIIGAAFTSVVNSLVNDILMPPIGLLVGNMDFSNMFISLNSQSYSSLSAAQDAGAATLNYGLFINSIIVFLITAFAVFLLVRSVNRLMRKQEAEPEVEEPHTKECPVCFTTIPIRAQRCPNCTSTLSAVSD
jgi:large conductance mechanosensitive channel